MARAEPTVKVTGLADGNATQMRAVGDHDQPLFVTGLGALFVRLGILEISQGHGLGFIDFRLSAVPHKDRQSPPHDGDRLPFGNCGNIELDARQGQGRSIWIKLIDQRPNGSDCSDAGGRASGNE